MEEMRVERACLRRQLTRQHQRLPEAAAAIWRRIAPEVPEPSAERGAVAAAPPHLPPRRKDAPGFLIEILGQVGDRRADLVMHLMALGIGRMPQRDDADIKSETLKRANLLRDEGLGQAGIPLQDEGYRAVHSSRQR